MKSDSLKQHLGFALFGLLMGLTLAATGFTDFAKVHAMFTFHSFTLLAVFVGALVLNGVGFAVLARGKKIPQKPFSKGLVPGSVLFGVGWAITGACPAVVLAQLGQAQFAAVFTLGGILTGVWVYRRLAAGGLNLDTGVCGEEA
ncbi:MAG TPA: YeeE/YedE thiosulfate transporter family protein [Gammaproteobacteria bacterium]|nr:YeeE/YedE thiosulfate transporter family protein [Gammaproteobacteria bacterium]